MQEFDVSGFESAIENLRKYGDTARGDVETNFNKALEDIVSGNREALSIIQELEGGDSTNAAKMVSLVRSPIDNALADVVRSMTDARQRGGYSGSPRVRSMIESTVRTLVPLAGEKVAEALATKERLGLKRAGIYESEGQQKAGINTQKGELLTKVGGDVASQIASIEKQREQAKQDEARRIDDLQLGLLQSSKPDSVTEFFSKLGMEPILKNVYAGTPTGSQLSGGGGGGGVGAVKGGDGGDIYSQLGSIDALLKAGAGGKEGGWPSDVWSAAASGDNARAYDTYQSLTATKKNLANQAARQAVRNSFRGNFR